MSFHAHLHSIDESLTAESLKQFYIGIDSRKLEVKELNEEIKDAFNSFASSTRVDIDVLKMGYKAYLKLEKDVHKAAAKEFEYQKLVDLMVPGETWKQEPLL